MSIRKACKVRSAAKLKVVVPASAGAPTVKIAPPAPVYEPAVPQLTRLVCNTVLAPDQPAFQFTRGAENVVAPAE